MQSLWRGKDNRIGHHILSLIVLLTVLPGTARSLPEETLRIPLSRAQVAKMSFEEFRLYCETRRLFWKDYEPYYAECLRLRNQQHLRRLPLRHRRQMRTLRKLLTWWSEDYRTWRETIVGPTTAWLSVDYQDRIDKECTLARIERVFSHPATKRFQRATLPEAQKRIEKEMAEADPMKEVNQAGAGNVSVVKEYQKRRSLALKQLKVSWASLKRQVKRLPVSVQEAIALYIRQVHDNAAIDTQ